MRDLVESREYRGIDTPDVLIDVEADEQPSGTSPKPRAVARQSRVTPGQQLQSQGPTTLQRGSGSSGGHIRLATGAFQWFASSPRVWLLAFASFCAFVLVSELALWSSAAAYSDNAKAAATNLLLIKASSIRAMFLSMGGPMIAVSAAISQSPDVQHLRDFDSILEPIAQDLDLQGMLHEANLLPLNVISGVWPPTEQRLASLNFDIFSSPRYYNDTMTLHSLPPGAIVLTGPIQLLPDSSPGFVLNLVKFVKGSGNETWGMDQVWTVPYAPGVLIGNVSHPRSRGCGHLCDARSVNGTSYAYWGTVILVFKTDVLWALLDDLSRSFKYKFSLQRISDFSTNHGVQSASVVNTQVSVVFASLAISLLLLMLMLHSVKRQTLVRQLKESAGSLVLERERLSALLVRQYELIAFFGDQASKEGMEKQPSGARLAPQEMIDNLRQSLVPGGTAAGEAIELQELIGSGSFGKVYMGLWRGTVVAVKCIMLPAATSRSDRAEKAALMETVISTSLSHPHLVQTFTYSFKTLKSESITKLQRQETPVEVSQQQDASKIVLAEALSGVSASVWSMDESEMHGYEIRLVLEYCDRGSLREGLSRGIFTDHLGLNYAAILETAADVAKGMLHLHCSNVLHSDLKSGNVMLKSGVGSGRGLHAKVMDFGLAIKLDHDEGQTHVSQAFQGTITHMAPEVLMEGKQSKAADVYAFGVTLWELYTGQMPYKGIQRVVLGHLIVFEHKRPAFPEGAPRDFRDLVECCWQPNPKQRPSFEMLIKELQRLREAVPGPTRAVHTCSGEGKKVAARQVLQAPAEMERVASATLATAELVGERRLGPSRSLLQRTRSTDDEIEADTGASWMISKQAQQVE